jgi:Organic solute transporter Ostalpha
MLFCVPTQTQEFLMLRMEIDVLWNSSFYLMLLTVLISLHLILSHLLNFSSQVVQRKIIAILWMCPIYSITSWLSLRFVQYGIYFDMLRDCYESIVLHMFFSLCCAYIGNTNDIVDQRKIAEVLKQKAVIYHVSPFNRILKPINLQSHPRKFLRTCKSYILQFVVMKPVTALFAIFLREKYDLYNPGNFDPSQGYLYLSLIVNFSISLSLYWLVMFYVATQKALEPHQPVPKFLCIKGVLFFSYWQSIVIAILLRLGIIRAVSDDFTAEDVCAVIQNALICLEMFFASIAHRFAFPVKPFRTLDRATITTRHFLGNVFNLNDVITDFQEIRPAILRRSTTLEGQEGSEVAKKEGKDEMISIRN